MNNRLAAKIVEGYTKRYLFMPSINWPPYYRDERLDAIWAADYIIQKLQSSDCDAIEVIKNYIYDLETSISLTDDRKKTEIFTTAAGTARDILSLFEKGDA